MRKIIKFVVIPLIIIILVLGTLLYIKYNTKEVNVVVKSLKGEKISDKIYGYKLNNDLDKNIVFSSPYKDYIYYALTDGNKVYYYRYNIYTLENKLLSEDNMHLLDIDKENYIGQADPFILEESRGKRISSG